MVGFGASLVASGAGGTIFSSIAAGAGVASQPSQPVSQQLFFFENMRARRPGFLQGSQQVFSAVSQQVGAAVSQQVFAGAHAFLAAILQRRRLNN